MSNAAWAKNEYLKVIVADPFIEMHSGPASGYPVFHVVERGEKIEVLKKKTDWFKVRTRKGVEGWVHHNEMLQTLTLNGKKARFPDTTIEGFRNRTWEIGLQSGDFEGAASITLYGSYYFTPTLSTEISFSQAIGNFSSNLLANVRLSAHPFPEWRVSPFFALGVGIIDTSPKGTLVQTVDRQDTLSHVSIGTDIYLTKRFILRLEYNNFKVFTSRNDNEEVQEWKAGFAVFF